MSGVRRKVAFIIVMLAQGIRVVVNKALLLIQKRIVEFKGVEAESASEGRG